MPLTFDPETLKTWDQMPEIDIETSRGGDAPVHRTTIWIVVDADTAYVRSVRGPAGRWYRELLANQKGAVRAAQKSVSVLASPANDSDTVTRVSDAIERKYRERWPGPTAAMLRDETLPTTLRLDPA